MFRTMLANCAGRTVLFALVILALCIPKTVSTGLVTSSKHVTVPPEGTSSAAVAVRLPRLCTARRNETEREGFSRPQVWTFVRMHLAGTISVDFLTVPTVTFRSGSRRVAFPPTLTASAPWAA